MRDAGPSLELHPEYEWGPAIELSPARIGQNFPGMHAPLVGVCGAAFSLCDLESGAIHGPGLPTNAVCPAAPDPVGRRLIIADHEGLVSLALDGKSGTRLATRPNIAYDLDRAAALGIDPAGPTLPAEFDWLLQVSRDGQRILTQLTLADASHHVYVLDAAGREKLRFPTGPAWIHADIAGGRVCLAGFRGGIRMIDLDQVANEVHTGVPACARLLALGLDGPMTDARLAPAQPMLAVSCPGQVLVVRGVDGNVDCARVAGWPTAPRGAALTWSSDARHLWVTTNASTLWSVPVEPELGTPSMILRVRGGAEPAEPAESGGLAESAVEAAGPRTLVSDCGRHALITLVGMQDVDEAQAQALTGGLPFGLSGIDAGVAHGPRPVEFIVWIDLAQRSARIVSGLPQGMRSWLGPLSTAGS